MRNKIKKILIATLVLLGILATSFTIASVNKMWVTTTEIKVSVGNDLIILTETDGTTYLEVFNFPVVTKTEPIVSHQFMIHNLHLTDSYQLSWTCNNTNSDILVTLYHETISGGWDIIPEATLDIWIASETSWTFKLEIDCTLAIPNSQIPAQDQSLGTIAVMFYAENLMSP